MNRRRFFGFAAAALALVSLAVQPAGISAAKGTIGGATGPAIWRVSNNTGTVYLFGSFHLLPPGLRWQNGTIESAYASSGRLVTEVELDGSVDAGAIAEIRKQMILPPDVLLEDFISTRTYQQVVDAAADLDVPMIQLSRLRPWAAGMVITASFMEKHGFDPQAGVDRYFHKRASQDGKALGALETMQQQADALASLSEVEGDVLMHDLLRFIQDINGTLLRAVEAWRTGNVEVLEQTVIADLKQYPDAYDALLVRRNRAWIPQIEAFLRGGGTQFVVVGAAHLVGEDSVIAMLRAQGYRVERLYGQKVSGAAPISAPAP